MLKIWINLVWYLQYVTAFRMSSRNYDHERIGFHGNLFWHPTHPIEKVFRKFRLRNLQRYPPLRCMLERRRGCSIRCVASSTHKKNTGGGGTPGIQHPACIPVSCPPRISLLVCQCASVQQSVNDNGADHDNVEWANYISAHPFLWVLILFFLFFANGLRIFTNKWMMMKHQIFPDRPWPPHVCAYCKWTKVMRWNVLEHVAVWFCGNMLPHGSSCYLPGQFSQAAHWPPFPSTCRTRFLTISRRFRRCNRPTPNSVRWRTQGRPGPTCGGAEVPLSWVKAISYLKVLR